MFSKFLALIQEKKDQNDMIAIYYDSENDIVAIFS